MSEVNSFRNPSSEDNWRCKICTYLNPSALRYCSACQGWRFEHIFSESSPATASMEQTVVHLPSTSNNSIPLFLLPSPQTPIYSPSLEDFALSSPNSPSSSSSTPAISSPVTPSASSPLPITFRPSVASRILREPSSPIPTSPCIQRAYSPPPPLPPNEPLESIAEVLSERCPKPDPGVPILELPWDLELLYDRGRTLLMKISVRRNSKKAWELLQLAANRGHPAAQWDLLLRKPDSDEIDWDRAVEYYVMQMQTSTANNNSINDSNYNNNNMARGYDHGAIAAFCLGCCFLGGWGVERREDRAVALYKIAVRRGYIKGLNEVGWIYDHGLGGVSQDSVGAFQCFNLLANRGYALAQYNTGRCYRDGRGVPSDWNKAVEWLVRASEQGYHNAQRSLGSMFQVGENQSTSSTTTTSTTQATTSLSTPLTSSSEKPPLPTTAQKKNKVKKDVVRAMILYRDSASNGDPAGVHKIQEMTSNTRVIYRGSGVFKEPVSYFMEVKLRQRKQRHHHVLHHSNNSNNNGSSSNTNSPCNTPPQTVQSPILNSNNNNNNTKKEEEKKGEYWVPKLIDQCCLVLSRGKRDVWETANIPSSVKIKLDRETIQCSAGCGNAFYGKGRVTRSFVYMKLVVNNNNSNTRSLLLEQAKLRGNGSEYYIGTWRDFGANSETTAMWRDTRKLVTMPFCSGACAEGFLQRSYWDF